MSKKGNSDVCDEKIRKNYKKNSDGIYTVYTMKHSFQGPCQGPIHVPQKGNLIVFDQKVKTMKIQMISTISVHLMGCLEGGHMTNCLKL